MANKYLLLAGISALMFASCSDEIGNGGENTPPPSDNALTLKTLDLSSQSGRVSFPGQTRGPKADRLQLVARIAPLADAQTYHWSATGIAFSGGNAYISWHSNHQAKVPAEQWGGALDQISIQSLLDENASDVFTRTQTLATAKLNNVVADGNTLYFPLTCYKNGAVVGRMEIGGETIDTIAVPGSSANAVAVENGSVYAVSGFSGGAYSLNFDAPEGERRFATVENIPVSDSFGGKYIAGGYVLRTDDNASELVRLADGTVRSLGAPLKSTEKYAEAYDPANGEWYPLEGEQSAHFGKHTMAVADGYIYVGGGKGADKKNGLRVYGDSGETPLWENGTNTTAVCVEGDYVYAATGAGLRVYEKYNENPEKGEKFKLFAYEVAEYDNTGMAIGHTAGTAGHSGNFVAVDPVSKLIFVAYGQSGVYVFRLDSTIPDQPAIEPVTVTVTFKESPEGNNIGTPVVTEDVEPGTNVNVDDPEAPVKEGMEFMGWSTDPNATDPEFPKDQPIEIPAGNSDTEVILYPVYSPEAVEITWLDGYTDTPVKKETVNYGSTLGEDMYPADPTRDGFEFAGWTINGDPVDFDEVAKGDVTITAQWAALRTIHYDGGKLPQGAPAPSNMPADDTSVENPRTVSASEPTCGNLHFCGWSTNRDLDPATTPDWKDSVYRNKDTFNKTFTFAADQTSVTLYAVWSSTVIGGEVEGPIEKE